MAFIGRMLENYMKTPLPGTFGYVREEAKQTVKKAFPTPKAAFSEVPLRQPLHKDACNLRQSQQTVVRSTPEQIRAYNKLVMRVAKDYQQTLGHLELLLLQAQPFFKNMEQFYSHQQTQPLNFDFTNPEILQQQLENMITNHAIAKGLTTLKINLGIITTRLKALTKAQDVFSNKFISRAERETKAKAFLSGLEPPLSDLQHS